MSSILNSTTTTEGLNKSLMTNGIKNNIKARTKLVKLSIKDLYQMFKINLKIQIYLLQKIIQ